jgi:Helix-turn-helix domain
MSERKKWKVMIDPEFLRKHDLKGNELKLYLMMMSYKRAHDTCWPARSTLAKDLGITTRSVDRCKAALERKQLVSWAHKKVAERLVDEYVLGENITAKSRFNFSTSLPSSTGDDVVSPGETETSPYRRRKSPPKKTNGRRLIEEDESKRIPDRGDDVEATSSPSIRGVKDTKITERIGTQTNSITPEASILPVNWNTSCSINLDTSCSNNLEESSPVNLDTSCCVDLDARCPIILGPIGCTVLEFDDEGNGYDEQEPIGCVGSLEFDDDDEERDRDLEEDIWAAYPFEIDALIPIYQEAHIKVFGVPYRLRGEEDPSTYSGILNGKPDPYMSYDLDSKDIPFVRENMEGIMTYAATPVPDPYRWKCKDYSPSVILNEGVVRRYRELLTLEALPSFSVHHGRMERTSRRTRRQERIWHWLTEHKNLPIWGYITRKNAA